MSKESAQAALGKFAEAVNTGNFDLFDQVVAHRFLLRGREDTRRTGRGWRFAVEHLHEGGAADFGRAQPGETVH